jgi:hypothetical protein
MQYGLELETRLLESVQVSRLLHVCHTTTHTTKYLRKSERESLNHLHQPNVDVGHTVNAKKEHTEYSPEALFS